MWVPLFFPVVVESYFWQVVLVIDVLAAAASDNPEQYLSAPNWANWQGVAMQHEGRTIESKQYDGVIDQSTVTGLINSLVRQSPFSK